MNATGLDGVTKRYGARTALDGVSLDLPEGAALGLLGPNGAGKTTTLRLLLGFARATSGHVSLHGRDPSEASARVGVGYLPERLRLPERTTGRRLLSLHGQLMGLPGERIASEVERVAARVRIEDRLDEPLGGLSKGLTQRVGFAIAFLGEPRLIVLDEPTSGLDPIGIREARGWIEAAREGGASILVSAHGLSEVERVCDRVAILDRGRKLVEGTLADLLEPGEDLEDAFVRIVRGVAP